MPGGAMHQEQDRFTGIVMALEALLRASTRPGRRFVLSGHNDLAGRRYRAIGRKVYDPSGSGRPLRDRYTHSGGGAEGAQGTLIPESGPPFLAPTPA